MKKITHKIECVTKYSGDSNWTFLKRLESTMDAHAQQGWEVINVSFAVSTDYTRDVGFISMRMNEEL